MTRRYDPSKPSFVLTPGAQRFLAPLETTTDSTTTEQVLTPSMTDEPSPKLSSAGQMIPSTTEDLMFDFGVEFDDCELSLRPDPWWCSFD